MSVATTLQGRAVGWIASGVLLLALGAWCWIKGADHVQQQWASERARRSLTLARIDSRSAQLTTQVVTEYVDRIKVIHAAGQTVIQEVPVYVDQHADAACAVPDAFVRLWNGANRGQLPDAARPADASASAVVLSDIARQHGVEASQCRETEQQLSSLQDWIRQQAAAYAEAE